MNAYDLGMAEFYKVFSVAKAPYPEGTENYLAWWAGYNDAQ